MNRASKSKHAKSEAALRAGARIRAAREARNLSVKNLSQATDGVLTPSRISNYEQGLRELPIDAAEKLARALETPAAYLMGLIDETDKELLSFPIEVRATTLSQLKATTVAAQQNSAEYTVSPTGTAGRIRTPAIHRTKKNEPKGEDDAQ